MAAVRLKRSDLKALAGRRERLPDPLRWWPPSPGEYDWLVQADTPFSFALSKNRMWQRSPRGRWYLTAQARAVLTDLESAFTVALRAAGVVPAAGRRLWVSLFVRLPNLRGDAVNVLDIVLDALKRSVGIDDRYFCLGCLNWEVEPRDPRVFVRFGQLAPGHEDA